MTINTINTLTGTKLLVYKTRLKQIKTYRLQLWGNAKKSSINKIQTFQNIALRKLTNDSSYVSNHTLHTDLKLKTINDDDKSFYKRFHYRQGTCTNPLIKNLPYAIIPGNLPRRLRRKWCWDLLQDLNNKLESVGNG